MYHCKLKKVVSCRWIECYGLSEYKIDLALLTHILLRPKSCKVCNIEIFSSKKGLWFKDQVILLVLVCPFCFEKRMCCLLWNELAFWKVLLVLKYDFTDGCKSQHKIEVKASFNNNTLNLLTPATIFIGVVHRYE